MRVNEFKIESNVIHKEDRSCMLYRLLLCKKTLQRITDVVIVAVSYTHLTLPTKLEV